MSLYAGCDCPICGRVFGESDDVVVCPECGSPQHRDCYKTVGHCGNEEYHAEKRQWARPQEEQPQEASSEEEETICHNCGAHNPAVNFFCQSCGQRLSQEQQAQAGHQAQAGRQQQGVFAGFMKQANLDYSQKLAEDVTVKDACDYVGANALPFALKFRMLSVGGSLSFNWCAFFFGFFYCFYRKMYKLGAVLLAIFLVMLIPTGYYTTLAFSDIMSTGAALTIPPNFVAEGPGYQGLVLVSMIVRIVNLVTMMLCGLFFNKLYFSQMVRQVRKVKDNCKASPGTQECSYALAASGGVNSSALVVLVASLFVVYMLLGYIASSFLMKGL